MRQETDNEIDLLLRRMSRRDGGSARDAEVPIEAEHLDADELSSYAQNALPAAARARYTAHLADCSACRKVVTELSLSLGATAVAQVQTLPAPGGLKKFLASLFSPMVLRYAIPALGVVVVMVVGLIVMRQQRQRDFLAVGRPQSPPAAVWVPETTAPTPQAAPFSAANPAGERAEDSKERQERASKSTDVTPESTPAASADTAAAAPPSAQPTPAAAKDEKNEVVIAQKQVEALPAAPVIMSKSESEEQKKSDAVPKKAVDRVTVDGANTEVSTKRANEPTRDNFRVAEGAAAGRRGPTNAKTAENKTAGTGASTLGGVASVASSRGRGDEDNDKAETRSVSGRRFRKERGIWMDTAYDSSKEPVKVTRGSEQFRALVADEPGIRTIAEQLEGDVIVVWKGRAYRIH